MITIVLWALGILLYLLVGGFLAELFGLEGPNWGGFAICWPLAFAFGAVILPLIGITMVGGFLAGYLKDWIRSQRSRS